MTTEILNTPDVDERVVTTPDADIDDGNADDNLRHIVRPADNPDVARLADPTSDTYVQDMVDIARVRGMKLKALCGKVWVPKNNVAGRSTCDTCIGMAGMIRSGD